MTELNGDVWDADNHFYEGADAFLRHLPDKYRNAIQYVQVNGRTKIAVRGKISEYIPNPTFDVVASPGAWEGYYRGRNPEGKSLRELANPITCPDEFRNPERRAALLDEQGIAAAMMFPTLVSLLEERMRDDIELTHAVIHSFNQWILDEWTFDYQGRIFAVPVVTLPNVDKAVAELEFCVEHGARTVLVRPAPVPTLSGASTSPGMPEFDPFWRRTQELGVPVMMHASDSGYDRHASAWEGDREEYLPFKPNAFRLLVEDSRPIHDTICALIAHGMLHRNPGVRIGVIENGTSWLPRLIANLNRVGHKVPSEFAEDPVETFRRHFWVHPFHEDDVASVVDAIGADHVLFGSDFPHPEGLGRPLSFLNDLEGLPESVVSGIMGGNLRALLERQPAGV
jgi:predicted TIM-barrel fold metal-dependent hydrolase